MSCPNNEIQLSSDHSILRDGQCSYTPLSRGLGIEAGIHRRPEHPPKPQRQPEQESNCKLLHFTFLLRSFLPHPGIQITYYPDRFTPDLANTHLSHINQQYSTNSRRLRTSHNGSWRGRPILGRTAWAAIARAYH